MSIIEEHVSQSAAALDKFFIAWFIPDNIDIGILDTGSCRYCVLGQLFGDFAIGMKTLHNMGMRSIDQRGFDATCVQALVSFEEHPSIVSRYNEAWIDEIDRRRWLGTIEMMRSE